MQLPSNKKIYFASDQHFGAPTAELSFPREQKFVAWFDEIPKGFVRVLGKLAEIRDSGIPIYFFVGNHDLWMSDYFEKELNIPVYRDNKEFTFNNKTFLIGHGDGKGPGDKGYKRMKRVFTNSFSKALFRWLHPDLGVKLGQYLSVKNKLISGDEDVKFLGEENEWLVLYSKRKLETKHYNYLVFGHRHLPMKITVGENSEYVNLGDWIGYFTYGVFDGENFEINKFETK
jgi:UDP-2,3-diacylglucosamine hydrolase